MKFQYILLHLQRKLHVIYSFFLFNFDAVSIVSTNDKNSWYNCNRFGIQTVIFVEAVIESDDILFKVSESILF